MSHPLRKATAVNRTPFGRATLPESQLSKLTGRLAADVVQAPLASRTGSKSRRPEGEQHNGFLSLRDILGLVDHPLLAYTQSCSSLIGSGRQSVSTLTATGEAVKGGRAFPLPSGSSLAVLPIPSARLRNPETY
jgi:hypothetical protein